MTAPKKSGAKKSGAKGSAKVKNSGKQEREESDHRVPHQITLSVEATRILDRCAERLGKGTKSMCTDMAIRYAERQGFFDSFMSGGGEVEKKPMTLDEALIAHVPTLLGRLIDHAKGTPPPATGS